MKNYTNFSQFYQEC